MDHTYSNRESSWKLGEGGASLGRSGWSCCRGASGHFGGAGAEDHFPPDLGLEPEHLSIFLNLDIVAARVTCRVITRVVARRMDMRSLSLDGVNFASLAVKGLGKQGSLQWSYDGAKIQVTWDKSFKKGEQRELEVSYVVENPASGLFFMSSSAAYPRKPTYAATDHETERARYWLACVDHPSVRTTLDFEITAAADLTILANGYLVDEKVLPGQRKCARWRLEQRCPSYLVCFAVGDFVKFEDGEVDGVPLAAFACPDFTNQDLQRSFGRTRPMMQWLHKRLGVKFPYPKYYQFALPAFSGAMENISLVSWSDAFLLTEATEAERAWTMDLVNIHEMAHSYFGDLVVCRDFAHAWLKESWATYMEACWLEHARGEPELRYDLLKCADAYFKEADERYKRPMVTRHFTSSWQMYDRHLYPGGACRLHTLRQELGDDCFWPAVSDYLTTFREQVVETDDFRRSLERHSGRSLQKFFDQWFATAGYPDIKVNFKYDSEKRLGTFEIEQKQATGPQAVRAFDLKTEVGWTVDGTHHVQTVHLEKSKHVVTIRMDKDPDQVRFDPNGKILHKLEFDPGETKLVAQLKGGADVVGRIQAARVLCLRGARTGILAVIEAYGKEAFWGVRREMVAALAESQTEVALCGIVGLVSSEGDPLVLDRVLAAAGEFRDARVTEAIVKRLEAEQIGPVAKGVAYWALGRQRDKAVIPRLRDAAVTGDAQVGEAEAQAFMALASTREDEVGSFLLEQVKYGVASYRARSGVVAALGALAPFVSRSMQAQVEDRLVDLLRDPEPWIRMGAARALGAARHRGAGPHLEAYLVQLPKQEQVVVDAILRELRADEDSRARTLEAKFDDLREKYRKLDDKLQSLEDRLK